MIADNLKPSLERVAKSEEYALAVARAIEIALEQQRKSRKKKVVRVTWACHIIMQLLQFFSFMVMILATNKISEPDVYLFRCKAGQMLEQELSYHKFPNEPTRETTAKIPQLRNIESLKETLF